MVQCTGEISVQVMMEEAQPCLHCRVLCRASPEQGGMFIGHSATPGTDDVFGSLTEFKIYIVLLLS